MTFSPQFFSFLWIAESIK